MKCIACEDSGILQNGMHRVVYCSCQKGNEEYQRNVLDKPCWMCEGTGKYINNGGREKNCCSCEKGKTLEYPNGGGTNWPYP